jgi:hypothetical protein
MVVMMLADATAATAVLMVDSANQPVGRDQAETVGAFLKEKICEKKFIPIYFV